MADLLTEQSVLWLPLGTVVEVTWSGGNGPHHYTVDGHSKSGVPRLATERDVELGLIGTNYLDGPLGPKPLTEARIVKGRSIEAIPLDFRRWFRAMPPEWQEGLWVAILGGAWRGELLSAGGGAIGPAVVFFVHPSMADAVEGFITGGKR